jgi:hypothetical protein
LHLGDPSRSVAAVASTPLLAHQWLFASNHHGNHRKAQHLPRGSRTEGNGFLKVPSTRYQIVPMTQKWRDPILCVCAYLYLQLFTYTRMSDSREVNWGEGTILGSKSQPLFVTQKKRPAWPGVHPATVQINWMPCPRVTSSRQKSAALSPVSPGPQMKPWWNVVFSSMGSLMLGYLKLGGISWSMIRSK